VNYAAKIALRVLMWFGIVLAALMLLYALILAFFDFNRLKGPVERLVHERTGRELAVNGNLDLTWGWPLPRVRVEEATFSNPGWAREEHMFSVEKAEVAISLPRLLAGQLHLTEVLVAAPRVALEIHADGRKNWLLDPEQRDEKSSVGIDRLRIDKGRLQFFDRIRKTDIAANFTVGPESASAVSEEEKREAKGDAPRAQGERTPSGLSFDFKGLYRGVPVNARGSGGSVLTIRDENIAFPLKLTGKYGNSTISADGTVNGLTTLSAVDLEVALKGQTLAELAPLVGAPALPDTKPYATSGRLVHHDKVWRYEEFSGRLGESDLAGHLSVDNSGERVSIKADLRSKVLQIGDFGSLVGAEEVKPGRKKQKPATKNGVFPDTPLPTERWDAVNADVKVRAKSFRAGPVPLENLDTHFTVKDRVITLDPFNARMAGGSVVGNVTLDGKRQPARGKVDARLQKVYLSELLPQAARQATRDKVRTGRVDGRVTLSGAGESIGALLGDADGRVSLVIDGGHISNYITAAVGLDLWEMLRIKLTGDKEIEIRCGVADFAVKDGSMLAQAVILDTADTKVTVTGDINLGRESLNLTLHPEPKDKSPLSLRSPIHIRGDLSKPDVQLDKGRIAARGLGALALGVVNPLLALVPLIETGPGLDSDCGKMISDAKQSQKQPPKQSQPSSKR
jgi:uncharacterized protein involved in outer membrane biogenesis